MAYSEERSALHDAMPYVDRDYETAEMKARVDKMVAEELARGGNRETSSLPKDVELFAVGLGTKSMEKESRLISVP